MSQGIVSTDRASPRGYAADYYNRNKANGLDLLSYGEWQERYGRWIVDALRWRGDRVLDVGCACGSMLRGLWKAGADIDGVDCSDFLVQAGRTQWPDIAARLFVCDAVNLHFIPDKTYDGLHSCVVAEHWMPGLVPHILRELRRVVKPEGLFYCAYESDTGAMADGRNPADEPSHICLRPPEWWEQQVVEAGWQVVSHEWEQPLRSHRDSFLNEYGWAWFVARCDDCPEQWNPK